MENSDIGTFWQWTGFIVCILIMLYIDLKVFHKKNHKEGFKEALLWTLFWILIALVFNAGIFLFSSSEMAISFFTAYIVEKSLSIDNLFVFLMIFSYFSVPNEFHHRILFWGILGAIIMRGIFIITGVTLLQTFGWMIYIFGIFLVITGIKMLFQQNQEVHPEKNPFLKMIRKIIPVTETHPNKEACFFIRINGKLLATPLLFVLITIEFSDVLFAVDSVPAVLAITTNSFIAFTSNIMAILGLRALYFVIADIIPMFYYLKTGLSIILIFIGLKMTISEFYPLPTYGSLLIIISILFLSIIASIIKNKRKNINNI